MTKRIFASLKVVLDKAVQIINFIMTQPLQSRVFKALGKDMGSHQMTLPIHTEAMWLSRGNVPVQTVQL